MFVAEEKRGVADNPAQYIEWDVRNWSAALTFWQQHSSINLAGCEALEIGTRNGGLSLWLASQGARVVSTDIEPPTPRAVRLHEINRRSDQIRYELMDATHIPYSGQFDVVVFKSVLGAIGRVGGSSMQQHAVDEMYKALKPGGELFFAENLLASPVHQFCRRRFVRWGSGWRYVAIGEMRRYLSRFSQLQYATVGFAGAFGRSERQRNFLSFFDRMVFDRTLPESWRYIMVGVARR
jgi:SAM-dependent methyltransferase